MKIRGYVRITSFMVFGLAVLIATAIINTRNMNEYKNQLEISYQHSLSELSECLDTVNTDLTKSLYSNSPEEQRELSRDLFAQCSVAKNAVSRLPVSQMELGNTYKFLSQASDYAQYIGMKLESGKEISEQEHKNLRSLLNYANQFSESASAMMHIVSGGAKITDGSVKSETKVAVTPLSNSFSESAKTFESYPTLLYDGPFSDQILNKKSQLVSNADVKTKEQCQASAASCLGVNDNKVVFNSDDKSKLPCYTFQSGRYTVSVTKQGGYIKSVLYSGIINRAEISEENAVNLAGEFLKKIGYDNMAQSYYSTADNVCTINFAYSDKNVICYSDLIKVGVSLSDGKVVSLDAATYLTNHTDRSKWKSKISSSEAQGRLSPYLRVNGVKKCVIPKPNGQELQCYEFSCTSKDTGEDTLVYLNNKTGAEEDIMLLLYTDNGTLVK